MIMLLSRASFFVSGYKVHCMWVLCESLGMFYEVHLQAVSKRFVNSSQALREYHFVIYEWCNYV